MVEGVSPVGDTRSRTRAFERMQDRAPGRSRECKIAPQCARENARSRPSALERMQDRAPGRSRECKIVTQGVRVGAQHGVRSIWQCGETRRRLLGRLSGEHAAAAASERTYNFSDAPNQEPLQVRRFPWTLDLCQ